MKGEGSIRRRLVVSAVLWTAGLAVISNFVIIAMAMHRVSNHTIHYLAMVTFAAALLIAALTQIRRILTPFKQLGERLADVRSGRERRVEGVYPAGVAPLVRDLNGLLDHQAALVQRAMAKAGDLAHGLKTPLAVLGHEAERLAAAGNHEAAVLVGQQVERMRRQIDYHLARARAAAAGSGLGVGTLVAESAEGLVRTLARLHAEKGVVIGLSIPEGHAVRVQREDLDEMLGNLLDNACKWTRSAISLHTEQVGSRIEIRIDDDGPGLPIELRTRVLQRGVRADEAAPGSGIGLAIVADLAEAYGGSIVIDASPSGGVRARLTLPAATASD